MLSTLTKAETADREVRLINYQMKTGKFPVYRDPAGFNFEKSDVDQALIKRLFRGEFIDDSDNVVLVGGPGTGNDSYRFKESKHQKKKR